MRSARLAPRSAIRSLLLVMLAAAVACGGAEASDLFGGSGASTSDGGANNTDGASTDDGATANDGGGGGKDGAVDKDTGRPQDQDSSVPDTGKPNADPGISCGQNASGEINCNPATQYCCGTASGGSAVNLECKATVSLCSGVKIGCDDSADCPTSQYCCGTFVQNSGYTKIACSTNPACGTPSGGTTYVRFCDPDAVPSECANDGKTCTGQSGSFPGYTYCK
jgi:hypothetical protein